MAPYTKGQGHSQTQYVTVYLPDGTRHQLSTETHDRALAVEMEAMLVALGRRGSRAWDLVTALVQKGPTGRRRLSLARLYDAYRADQDALGAGQPADAMVRLRAALDDVDLAPTVTEWLTYLATSKRAAVTIKGYRIAVRHLVPDAGQPLWRSQFTPTWLASQRDTVPGQITTRIAYCTAWSSWCGWLVERGLLADNPMRRVKWPTAPTKGDRVRHITRLADVQRFVAAFVELEDRAIAALRESTGADWDGLEPMHLEHIVDRERRLVFLPGDKTGNRAREVEVEPWAWGHVEAYLRTVRDRLPGAPLFTVKYSTYLMHHRATRDGLIAAGVSIPKGYTPHNARHSFAVRKRRAGWDDWAIARYLGNTAREIQKVYGVFTPDRRDLAQDAQGRRREQGQSR